MHWVYKRCIPNISAESEGSRSEDDIKMNRKDWDLFALSGAVNS
jgi:hypothetical protein